MKNPSFLSGLYKENFIVMYANYHTHTYRCGHASGREEEYIKNAISGGIKIMGFSDHVPFAFENGNEYPWHVQTKDAEDYMQTLLALRQKYKNDIKIHIGFEMEYSDNYFDEMLAYVKSLGAEFLILGQHFSRHDSFEKAYYSSGPDNTEANLISYTDLIIKGIKTGVFSYVAHPDIFNYVTECEEYKREARRLCEAAKEYDIPLEINLLGIYDKRWYPNDIFWSIVGEVGNRVVFGFDAHTPERAYDGESLKKAETMVKKFGLNLIDEIKLKKI